MVESEQHRRAALFLLVPSLKRGATSFVCKSDDLLGSSVRVRDKAVHDRTFRMLKLFARPLNGIRENAQHMHGRFRFSRVAERVQPPEPFAGPVPTRENLDHHLRRSTL